METTTTLNAIGGICLLLGWVIPAVMSGKNESTSVNKHLVGMLLAALALGFFASALVVGVLS